MPKPLPIPPKPFQSIGDLAEDIIAAIKRRQAAERAEKTTAPPPSCEREEKDGA